MNKKEKGSSGFFWRKESRPEVSMKNLPKTQEDDPRLMPLLHPTLRFRQVSCSSGWSFPGESLEALASHTQKFDSKVLSWTRGHVLVPQCLLSHPSTGLCGIIHLRIWWVCGVRNVGRGPSGSSQEKPNRWIIPNSKSISCFHLGRT